MPLTIPRRQKENLGNKINLTFFFFLCALSSYTSSHDKVGGDQPQTSAAAASGGDGGGAGGWRRLRPRWRRPRAETLRPGERATRLRLPAMTPPPPPLSGASNAAPPLAYQSVRLRAPAPASPFFIQRIKLSFVSDPHSIFYGHKGRKAGNPCWNSKRFVTVFESCLSASYDGCNGWN